MPAEKVSKVAFYVTKRRRSELRGWASDRLEELVRMIRGRRMVARFGTWRRSAGANVRARPPSTSNRGPEACPRFGKCNAPVCPLDPDWQKRLHLPGEPTCHYLRLATKGVTLAGEEAAIGVAARRVLESLALITSPSRWGALQRAVAAAAKRPPKRGRFRQPAGGLKAGSTP